MIKSVIYVLKTVSTYNYEQSECQMFILKLGHNTHKITMTYAKHTIF